MRPSAPGPVRATATRRHFEFLDALRGIAAIVVMLYHLGHWSGVTWLATNGYLAVDFFFCLSGFVVALAYGRDHAPQLVFQRFAFIRLTRLMPLIVLANVVAASYVSLRLFAKPQHDVGGSLTTALLLGAVSMPYFHAPSWIGGPQVFPLNGPQYTLFLEIVANLVWFVFRRHIGLRGALVVAAVGYGGVCIWGLGGDTTAGFLSGLPRVLASFYAGVAVCDLRDRYPAPCQPGTATFAFLALSTLLVAILLYPHVLSTGAAVASVVLLSPTIVLAGSLCHVPRGAAAICTRLGDLSYPIYTLHYPVFCWSNGVLQAASFRSVAIDILTCLGLIVLCSWYALGAFDRPVRRWLSQSVPRKVAPVSAE